MSASATNETLLILREAGLKSYDIALKLGCSRRTVDRRLRRLDAPMLARPWTPAEHEQFNKLYASSASIDQIAARLGRSSASIRKHAERAGVHRPKSVRVALIKQGVQERESKIWPPERDAELTRLWRDKGKTKKETAEALGCTFHAVSGRIRDLGLKRDIQIGRSNALAAHPRLNQHPRLSELKKSPTEIRLLRAKAKRELKIKIMLSQLFQGVRAEGAVYRPKFL